MSATITDQSAFREASLAKQAIFAVITFGLYTIYWTYKTAKTFDRGTDQNLTPILAIIPLVNIIAFWQISNASESVTEQGSMPIFLLFLFFPIISWYWVQTGINSAASQ
ncbi:hypothetical protein C482_15943 [Natrialba chahannaoensis JCM 10990]|uniref:DUF4234 domain-containing protein n=1 Tax=Natrialba chahannaoensis JCM 10990 TaxID=1227492 RepID=M0ADQ4_9EURY|nr:DUF4234 domain-containing protein [Natrialba chahannaoensis]ELY96506.1 hypothetical protein C482_15943 [Natrialba chahannaoensis JCM 10990]